MPMPTRISPRSSKRLKASRRDLRVLRSAFGEFDPSTARKIGSRPAVWSNRRWINSGVTVIPASGTWQLEQERPLVPSDWKNGLLGSLSGPPEALMVREKPKRFGTRISLRGPCSDRNASTRARSDSTDAVVRFASAPHPDHRTTSADTTKVKPRYCVPMCSPPERTGQSESVRPARDEGRQAAPAHFTRKDNESGHDGEPGKDAHASTRLCFRHHERSDAMAVGRVVSAGKWGAQDPGLQYRPHGVPPTVTAGREVAQDVGD